jgi:hypothetical protein
MAEEYEDSIIEDPDEQVNDDEMSPAEAAFSRGAEQASQGDKSEESEDDEVY